MTDSPRGDLFTGVIPFVTTAEVGSVRGAARALGVTPSAVSKAIARLEERLGVQLMQRTSRRVRPTSEGEEILALYRDAVANALAARDVATRARERVEGLLHVTASPVLGRSLLARALPHLRERHPALRLRLTLTDRLLRFADDDVDVALRIGSLADSDAHAWPVRETRWRVVGAPGYLARRGRPTTPADLRSHACLRFLAPDGRPRDWSFEGEASPLAVDGPLLCDDGETLVAAAVAGLGLVQAMDFMVDEAIGAGRLLEVLADHATAGPPVWAVAAPGRHRAVHVRAFVEHMREALER